MSLYFAGGSQWAREGGSQTSLAAGSGSQTGRGHLWKNNKDDSKTSSQIPVTICFLVLQLDYALLYGTLY